MGRPVIFVASFDSSTTALGCASNLGASLNASVIGFEG